MTGELFLYRGVSTTEIDAMTFSRMQFWHKFHEYENERIEKENRRRARKKYHPDA